MFRETQQEGRGGGVEGERGSRVDTGSTAKRRKAARRSEGSPMRTRMRVGQIDEQRKTREPRKGIPVIPALFASFSRREMKLLLYQSVLSFFVRYQPETFKASSFSSVVCFMPGSRYCGQFAKYHKCI